MGVGEAILALGAGERPASFDQFSAAIDPQWIADALAATDTASVRRRELPAGHVVWLVRTDAPPPPRRPPRRDQLPAADPHRRCRRPFGALPPSRVSASTAARSGVSRAGHAVPPRRARAESL